MDARTRRRAEYSGRSRVATALLSICRAALPLLQLTAAASLAWVIASRFGGHPDPFFAPIAAVVALSSPLGERGSNALRLVLGVMVGIVIGELSVFVFGAGYGRIALAIFVAMSITRIAGASRLVTVQAAASAILTVAAADGDAGFHRLVDAGIGAAVALLFSQVLLSPEPVRLVRRAAADALAVIAEGLTLTARALETGDQQIAANAFEQIDGLLPRLFELDRLRTASPRVARHSVIWRSRIRPAVTETANSGHIELLGASCRSLARVALMADGNTGLVALAPDVGRLGASLAVVAADLGDRSAREAAADQAIAIARGLNDAALPADRVVAAASLALQVVAVDVLIVAGVQPDTARAAVVSDTDDLAVPTPPSTPRLPNFGPPRRSRRPG